MVAVKQDQLETPISRVREALAENSEGHEIDWVRQVGHTVEDLIHALKKHVSGAEAPNGPLTTLASPEQDTVATLDRLVRQLRIEHVELLDNANRLSHYIEGIRTRDIANVMDGVAERDIPIIHEMAEEILDRLEAHNDSERDLLSTVVTRDEPGAGD